MLTCAAMLAASVAFPPLQITKVTLRACQPKRPNPRLAVLLSARQLAASVAALLAMRSTSAPAIGTLINMLRLTVATDGMLCGTATYRCPLAVVFCIALVFMLTWAQY